jgi:long-chain acyl-CoA synthetase
MSVGEMVQELDFISPERTYLFLPLAHAFALTAQLASFELGTTIIFYGGDSKKILEELVETSPTYLPSVPRIFEKLYTAAMKLQEQGDEREQARFAKRSSSASRCAGASSTASRSPTRCRPPSIRPTNASSRACGVCSAARSVKP